MEGFQKEFTLKYAVCATANAWNNVYKDTFVKAWHNLWLTMFSDDDEQNDDWGMGNSV